MAVAASQFRAFGSTALRLANEGGMPSLRGASAWLNSQPLANADLRGKVILAGFWTYTCINWRRTLPYLRAWDAKYRQHGLIVIGVHTPEFAFEHDIENVRLAAKTTMIDYPIAIDNNYAVWNAFENQYWPALYFIDASGHIRSHQFGEGDYDKSELILQQLLTDAGASGFDPAPVAVDPSAFEVAADWRDLKSGENYVGYDRTENFASPHGLALGKARDYALPSRLSLNEWALAGNWTAQKGSVALNAANGRIAYRFHSRDLHLVMGPNSEGGSGRSAVRFRVLIDGEASNVIRGADVDEQGMGTVIEPRMYQLVRQPLPIADRTFEIEFLDPGVEVYSFTFG